MGRVSGLTLVVAPSTAALYLFFTVLGIILRRRLHWVNALLNLSRFILLLLRTTFLFLVFIFGVGTT